MSNNKFKFLLKIIFSITIILFIDNVCALSGGNGKSITDTNSLIAKCVYKESSNSDAKWELYVKKDYSISMYGEKYSSIYSLGTKSNFRLYNICE